LARQQDLALLGGKASFATTDNDVVW